MYTLFTPRRKDLVSRIEIPHYRLRYMCQRNFTEFVVRNKFCSRHEDSNPGPLGVQKMKAKRLYPYYPPPAHASVRVELTLMDSCFCSFISRCGSTCSQSVQQEWKYLRVYTYIGRNISFMIGVSSGIRTTYLPHELPLCKLCCGSWFINNKPTTLSNYQANKIICVPH